MLHTIENRRSYRGAYETTPVPRGDLVKILEAGLAAPSGCNKQTTSLIAVDDPGILETLYSLARLSQDHRAPAMICVLTRRIIAHDDRSYFIQDYAAAIQNMLLAITALGYHSCWYEGRITGADRIGGHMAKVLGVPGEYELVCFLPVGIAKDQPTQPKKLDFSQRAWFNGFQKEQC